MNGKNQGTYRRINTIGSRLLIAFVLIVLLPAIVISSVSAVSGQRNGQRQVLNQLESVATLKEAEIETWLNSLTNHLPTVLAGAGAMQRANVLLQASPDAADYAEAHDELQGRFRQTVEIAQLFEEVFLIDTQGQIVLSTDAAQEGKILKNQAYFQPLIHENQLSTQLSMKKKK